jgi:hypothetical protein
MYMEAHKQNKWRISNRAEARGPVLIVGSRSHGSIGVKVNDLLDVLKTRYDESFKKEPLSWYKNQKLDRF